MDRAAFAQGASLSDCLPTPPHHLLPIALTALLLPLVLHASTLSEYIPVSLWTYDLFRWLNTAALSICMLICLWGLRTIGYSVPCAALGLATWLIMGLTLARNFHMGGAAEFLLITMLVVTGWLMAQLARETPAQPIINQLSLAVLLIATLYSVRGLAAWLPHCIHDGTCHEFYGNYLAIGNRRAFNQIQTALMPFLFWLVMIRPAGRTRGLALIVTAIMVWMIITTGARGTAVALISTGFVVAWRYGWTRDQWRGVGIAVGLGIGLACASLIAQWVALPHGVAFEADYRDGGRIELWITAFQGALDAPLLGQGPGAFGALGLRLAHAHNVLADIAHDYGLIAALVAVTFITVTVLLALFRLDRNLQPIAWAACALLAHSMVSGVHIYPVGQITLTITTALVWAWSSPLWSSDFRCHRTFGAWSRIPLSIGLTIVTALLIATLVITFPDYSTGPGFAPRLWLGGHYDSL